MSKSMYLAKEIKANNKLYVYDALYNHISESSNDLLRDIFKPIKFEIIYPYSKYELNNLISSSMSSINVVLTEQCNLRCKYCGYMSKYLGTPLNLRDMDESILFKAVDLLLKSNINTNIPPAICFYGGEPLLKFELIKKCLKYCKNVYSLSSPNFYITTNGMILDNEYIIDFLVENKFYVTVSLDGPKHIHNKYRIQNDGKPSFDKVFDNLIKLYKRDPGYFKSRVMFNSVICPSTGCMEQYDFLDSICKSDIMLIDCNITNYFSNILKTEKDKSEKIYYHPIMKKGILKNMKKYHDMLNYPFFQQEIFPGGFCIPGTRKNFVTIDGKVVVCEKVNENENIYQIGDVFGGISEDKVKKLIDVTSLNLQKCKTCWAAKFCSVCFKDIFDLTEEFCQNSRKRIERELIYYLENVKDNKQITRYLENLSIQ